MVTLLITSFLLIAVIIYAVYWWQQTPSGSSARQDHTLPPQPGWAGLFHDETANQKQLAAAESEARETLRSELLARAAEGDRSVLADARASCDTELYDEVLNRLVERADTGAKLLALVSYMMKETPALGVNRKLAEKFMDSWRSAADRSTTAKMLHIVALANDASLYLRGVEAALDFWRAGRIPDLTAEELRSLAESEYWVLSQKERSSGQGFLLKMKLAALRRELTRG